MESSPLLRLTSLVSFDSDQIRSSATRDYGTHIVSLILTTRKDLLLCIIEKGDGEKQFQPPNFIIRQIEWFSNELSKGCVVEFSPSGDVGVVVSENLNIYTVNIHAFLYNKNVPGNSLVKQIFIGSKKNVIGSPSNLEIWENHEGHRIAAIADKSGHIAMINLTQGILIGDFSIEDEGCVISLNIYEDDPRDSKFLLIQTSEKFYRLLVDQKTIGYTWAGGGTGTDPPPTIQQENILPDIVESRGRLSGLKQMSVEKITNLRNRLAEGRKLLRSRSESDDLCSSTKPVSVSAQIGPSSLVNVNTMHGRDFLCLYHPSQCQSSLLDSQLDPLQKSTKSFPFLQSCSVRCMEQAGHLNLFSTTSPTSGEQVIFSSTGAEDKNQNQGFQLQSFTLEQEEQMLGMKKVCLTKLESSSPKSSPNKPSPRSPFKGLVCVTTDQNGQKKTEVVQKSPPKDQQKANEEASAKDKDATPQKKFKKDLELEVEKVRKGKQQQLFAFILVTNRHVYLLNWVKHPVDLVIQLIVQGNIKDADLIGKSLDLDKNQMQEFAGDLRLTCEDFSTAISVYRQSGAKPLKIALKLAVFGSVDQLLSFLQVIFTNRNLDATHREKVHLANLTLISFFQQILRSTLFLRVSLEQKFKDFLVENRLYDEVLMVNQGVDTESWAILNHIVPKHGLYQELSQSLVCWFGEYTKLPGDIASKILDHLANDKELFLQLLLSSDLLVAAGTSPPTAVGLLKLVKTLLHSYSRSSLVKVVKMTNPWTPDLYPMLVKDSSRPELDILRSELLNLHVSALLSLQRKKSHFDSQLLQANKSFGTTDQPAGSYLPVVESNLSCGFSHVLYNQTGGLASWGSNNLGCTGLKPSYALFFTPGSLTFFSKLGLKVIQVSCGKNHSLALTDNGVYSWGSNQYGQLGTGTGLRVSTRPVRLPLDSIVQISCGQFHNLALDGRGSVYSWGWGVHGQLGHSSIEDERCPRLIKRLVGRGGGGGVVQIAAGYAHSLCLTKSGDVYAFGLGTFGQLGLGNSEKHHIPAKVVLDSPVRSIAAGYFHSLAVTQDDRLHQWGAHPQVLRLEAVQRKKEMESQKLELKQSLESTVTPTENENVFINNAAEVMQSSPIMSYASAVKAKAVSDNPAAESAVVDTDKAAATGLDANSANRDDSQSGQATCDTETTAGSKVAAAAADSLTADSKEAAAFQPQSLPVDIPTVSEQHLSPQLVSLAEVQGRILSMSCGSQHCLLLTDLGHVYTWGRNLEGQLGHGGRGNSKVPTRVAGLDQDFICSAACGSNFSVCVAESGSVFGWGSNSSAQLGRPPVEPEKGTDQSKMLLMKTSKRVIRLQHGLQNSCDIPKPVPGIPKSGIYASQVSRTPQEYSFQDFYARHRRLRAFRSKAPPQNYASFENDDANSITSLQIWTHRILENFSLDLYSDGLVKKCLLYDNYQAAAKLLHLDGSYVESFECLLKGIDSNLEQVSFQVFMCTFRAARTSLDFRKVHYLLLDKLVKYWKKNNLDIARLESWLLDPGSADNVGTDAATDFLNCIVYIVFLPANHQTDNQMSKTGTDDVTQRKSNMVDISNIATKPICSLFSPAFVLRLGEKFVQSSKPEQIQSSRSETGPDSPDAATPDGQPTVELQKILNNLLDTKQE